MSGACPSELHPPLLVEQPAVAVASEDGGVLERGIHAGAADGVLDRVEQREMFVCGSHREDQTVPHHRQAHADKVRDDVLDELCLTGQFCGQVAA